MGKLLTKFHSSDGGNSVGGRWFFLLVLDIRIEDKSRDVERCVKYKEVYLKVQSTMALFHRAARMSEENLALTFSELQ